MICPRCKGKRVCPRCKGSCRVDGASGMLLINVGAPGVPKDKPCPECNGTGWCPVCDGTGRISRV